LIVLDTASWIWLASDPRRLSARARDRIEAADQALVSAISVWEVSMLVARRRIELDRDVEDWVALALALPKLELASLDPAIAIRSTRLPGEFHADPADRIIVATAIERSAALITPDQRMRAYPHVRAEW
jgi:PIN domain nuclease of toxin-antitoxin system